MLGFGIDRENKRNTKKNNKKEKRERLYERERREIKINRK